MELKIEKNIPVPLEKYAGMTSILRKMKVGDSFLIKIGEDHRSQVNNALGAMYRIYGSSCARSRKVEGGTRIWRIK